MNINPNAVYAYNSENSSILLLAILSYPLFDLLRVFIVRIKQKKSPFVADSNHIHHRLLRLGLNHKQATMFLVVSNMTLIIITFFTNGLSINLHLIVVVAFGCLLYLLPFLSVFEEYKEENIVAEIQSSQTNEFAVNNVKSKITSNDFEPEEGVVKLMNTDDLNETNTVFNSNNLAQNRSRKLRFLASDKNNTVNGDASEIQLNSNELNTK